MIERALVIGAGISGMARLARDYRHVYGEKKGTSLILAGLVGNDGLP